jgi:hypothetical protein
VIFRFGSAEVVEHFPRSISPREGGMLRSEIWLRGMLAAVISGAANGAITGFAAIGIDPTHFNLAAGFVHTLSLAGVSAVMSGIIGVAAYLKQSPLPGDSAPESRGDRAMRG